MFGPTSQTKEQGRPLHVDQLVVVALMLDRMVNHIHCRKAYNVDIKATFVATVEKPLAFFATGRTVANGFAIRWVCEESELGVSVALGEALRTHDWCK